MKTFLKSIALAFALFTGASASAAQFDYYTSFTLLSGTVTNVAANTSNTVSYVIDCKDQEYVPIYLFARPNGTNRTWVNLVINKSVDEGVTYDSIDPLVVNITAATNSVGGASLSTNVFVGGYSTLKITQIGNLAGFGTMTNFVIKWGKKR